MTSTYKLGEVLTASLGMQTKGLVSTMLHVIAPRSVNTKQRKNVTDQECSASEKQEITSEYILCKLRSLSTIERKWNLIADNLNKSVGLKIFTSLK